MTRRDPNHWPDGTPKSQHNAFTQPARHRALGADSIFAADHLYCTSLYNNWRADQRAGIGPGAHLTWPQYRDTIKPKAKDFAHRAPGGQVNGFGANGGTIAGLSDKADALLAKQGKRMPIAASAWNGGTVKPQHAGAFCRAGTAGGSAKIHTPKKAAAKAKPAKRAARAKDATK